MALLVTAVLLAPFGATTRSGQDDGQASITVTRSATELSSSHAACRHVAEHYYDLLISPDGEREAIECADLAHFISPDRFPHQTTVNPLEHPPRV